MFMTFILACSLLVPNSCKEFVDTKGPYPTHKMCKERATYLAAQLTIIYNEPHEFSYKCVKVDKI